MEPKNNKDETKYEVAQILARMDVVVALLLRLIPKGVEGLSLREQVRILNNLKIRPVDISKITGRTQSHINKELVSIRKEK